MGRSMIANRRFRRARLRPTVQDLEARLLLTVGGLDPGFGGGTGYYAANLNPGVGTGITSLTQTIVESDNSILAAGYVGKTGSSSLGVIHVNAEGTLDTSFGNGGEADVVLPTGLTLDNSMLTMLVQGDGKIVLTRGVVSATATYALVARFDADGQPDPTFGTSGVSVVNLNTLGIASGTVTSATLQPNGEVVLIGESSLSATSPPYTQVFALRIGANGTLDNSFGTGGAVSFSDIPANTTPDEGYGEVVDGVVVQTSGKIVIVGSVQHFNGTNPQTSVM